MNLFLDFLHALPNYGSVTCYFNAYTAIHYIHVKIEKEKSSGGTTVVASPAELRVVRWNSAVAALRDRISRFGPRVYHSSGDILSIKTVLIKN